MTVSPLHAVRRRPPRSPLFATAVLAAVALVGGFGFLALALLVEPPARPPLLDREAESLASHLRARSAVAVLRVLTDLGSSPVAGAVLLAVAVWLGRRHRPREARALLGGALLSFVAVALAKAAVGRPRPLGSLIGPIDSASYPSGHAVYSVAFVAVAVLLVRDAPRRVARIGLLGAGFALAAFVGATRIYLRAHYLTDVLGGWCLAAGLFALSGLGALAVARLRHNARR